MTRISRIGGTAGKNFSSETGLRFLKVSFFQEADFFFDPRADELRPFDPGLPGFPVDNPDVPRIEAQLDEFFERAPEIQTAFLPVTEVFGFMLFPEYVNPKFEF